jgi:hypothetical protein
MDHHKELPKGLLFTLIWASAGMYKHYQFTFWGQLILGFLYSFGYFDLKIAGFILGFVMPAFWIILTYRYLLHKAGSNKYIPFPGWIQKNPGNTIVIFIDITFLGIIWTIILSGLYDPIWLKVLFTMALPILTLSMLRNLVIFPFPENDSNDSQDDQY